MEVVIVQLLLGAEAFIVAKQGVPVIIVIQISGFHERYEYYIHYSLAWRHFSTVTASDRPGFVQLALDSGSNV
jgi:uncharacterized membrane-anchored protein